MSSVEIPQVKIEADWEEMNLPFNIGSGRTPYTGQEKSGHARFRFFRRKSDGTVIGRAWFGALADGPPGFVHGGNLAFVLDEVMGTTSWVNLYPSVAAKLEFQYLRMSPLYVDLHIESKITSVTNDRLMIDAQVKLPTGETCVAGRGTFAMLTREQGENFVKRGIDPGGFLKGVELKWAKE
jgi:acyl-coenzyme A thioesterase PaaI-like protein